MTVKEIVSITRGKLLSGDPETAIGPSRLSTDSRNISKGDLFVALKGANFDGNDFVAEVLKKGALGAIVSPVQGRVKDFYARSRHGKVIIRVADTTKALQDIAAYHRAQFNIPVVCVTGSNGKTTVKDMAWHLLSTKYNVLRNEGTQNNHIGVPLTLLKLNKTHQICVLELGTNHKGEIALLAAIARPTTAVITNIGPSHLEFLGSLRGVFEAKSEIFPYIRKGGLLILNGDDKFLSNIKNKDLDIVKYGFTAANFLKAKMTASGSRKTSFIVNNKMEFDLNVLGEHNVYNALAAIAVALNFGIEHKAMRAALSDYRPANMRLEPVKTRGIDIINDSYNSNPLSMMHAIEVVKHYPARARWIVSADMLELGRESEKFHRMIGEAIANSGADGLMTFGEFSKYTLSQAKSSGMAPDRLWHCSSHDEIAKLLKKMVKKGDVVLFKGSRSMKMERVLEKFQKI